MKIKVCYNNETHRISRLPESFEDLTKLISSIFLSAIPNNWRLEYIDSDGDKIMLADEQDYKEFLDSEMKDSTSNTSVKVFIVPYDEAPSSRILSTEEIKQISNQNKDDDYNIINIPSEESSEDPSKEGGIQSISDVPSLEKENVIEEQPKSVENVDLKEEIAEVEAEKKMEDENAVEERPQLMGNNHEIISSVLKTEEQEEKKIEEKPVPVHKPKPLPKKISKPKAQPNADKPKKILQKVFINNQALEKLVQTTVEKNIAKIAMMTSSYLNHKTSNTQTQTQAQERPQAQSPVHRHVMCDGCKAAPLTGTRYKCSVCPDYDYCERCEQEKEHPHAFIKIKFPGHSYAHKNQSSFFHNFPQPIYHNFTSPQPCKMLFKEKQDSPAQAVQLTKETLDSFKKPEISIGIDTISMTTSQIIPVEDNKSKVQEQVVTIEERKVEEKNEIVEEEPEAKKVVFAPVYSRTVQNKALQMKDMLPEVNLDLLLSFVDNAPEDLDFAELVENFRY